MSRLTRLDLERYQAHRRRAGKAAETINSELATFAQVQAWAVEHRLHAAVICTDRVPPDRKVPDLLTREEYHRLLDVLPLRLITIVTFLAETGCRWGEGANLRWEDVDLASQIAMVSARANWTPKTRGSVRPLHLSPRVVRALQELPRTGDYVFPGRKRQRTRRVDQAGVPLRRGPGGHSPGRQAGAHHP